MSMSSPTPEPLTDADYTSANMTDKWILGDAALTERRNAARKRIAAQKGDSILGVDWAGNDGAGNSVGVGDDASGNSNAGSSASGW